MMLASVFKLTIRRGKTPKQFPVGQGLFFAGQNHVHIQIIASPTEQKLITTNPEEIKALEQAEENQNKGYPEVNVPLKY